MNEPPAHEPSAPGGRTAIGRYEILRDLGHGGMGSVHLAHDTQLRRQVALKLLLPERIERQDARLRFEREVHALSRLDHPNLCRLYDAGEVDGMPYLAMQFVAGETLAAAIESAFEGTKPLPGGAAPTRGATGELLPDRGAIQHLLTLFEKLARALHVAHQDGIVHRDIKPSNIMLAENGEPVLLDFGLALDEQGTGPSLTASDQSLGTPLYMAPEQVQPGRHPVDARTDVHGLAVTLYHALTLHAPFGGLTNHQIYQRILKEDARDPRALHPGIDRDLAIVLQTALAKEPAHRYRDAATFAEDLRRVRVREPILAKPPTVPERLVRWSQRNPLVAAFLGTVVLLLGAVSASLVTTSRALDAESIALQQSEDARTEMRTSIGYFNRLATIEDLRRATDEAKQLFPAWPEREADLESWLERRAAPLVAQLEAFRTELAALQAMPLAETAAPASLVTAERIEASTRAYLLQLMQENLPALEQAIGSEQGIVAQVRRRLHAARTVAVETLRHPGWPAASAAVRTDPRFAELDLVPQTDLVPLGADPVSGLQEFLHMPSHPDGEPPPARDPATGQVAWTERTGIVFVLVPGGTATMGAQQVDPAAPFHDPLAEEDEILHQVTLAPYLLSKFEMTQAQWERLAGANPSMFQPSYNATLPPPRKLPGGREASVTPFTLRHPVEQVTWEQCAEILRQQGLVLPTEAQWEHACRAGTTTPWYCAEDQLQFHANLPDQFSVFFTNGSYGNYHDWSDDHVAHAPVGSYRPNPFGLFDMHGNVGEWCQDPLLPYTNSVRAGDGLREPRDGDPLANQMYRGGDFRFLARESRSSNRLRSNRINEMGNTLGLRPARAILKSIRGE